MTSHDSFIEGQYDLVRDRIEERQALAGRDRLVGRRSGGVLSGARVSIGRTCIAVGRALVEPERRSRRRRVATMGR